MRTPKDINELFYSFPDDDLLDFVSTLTPDHPILGYPPLPDKFSDYRPQQLEVIGKALLLYREPKGSVVFIQAPPGAGKTLIGETLRRLLPKVNRTIYTCTTKDLQHQFADDFPYSRILMGRANYNTQSGSLSIMGTPTPYKPSDITCADCTFGIPGHSGRCEDLPDEDRPCETHACKWCTSYPDCPYQLALSKANTAPVAVLNTAYLLTDANLGRGRFATRDLVIIDEADKLEGELLNHMNIEITALRRARMNLSPPRIKTATAKSNDWAEWVDNVAVPTTYDYLDSLDPNGDAKEIREIKATNNLIENLRRLGPGLREQGWIYTGHNEDQIVFKPVRLDSYGHKFIWPHGKKFLLMSGTILSAELRASELGLDWTGRKYAMIDVPSVVPVSQRPIHIVPVADMTMKKADVSWPIMLKALYGVLRNHPDERILIHSVSYKLTEYIVKGFEKGLYGDIDRKIVTYGASHEKKEALARFKATPSAVMVAPSMDRGIDLPGDLCRVMVVAKIPHPNLGDKRISTRSHIRGGQLWYRMQAIATFIQMTGRGVRGADDSAITYVLDKQFTNLWKSDHLFPLWIREAMNWKFPPQLLFRKAEEGES